MSDPTWCDSFNYGTIDGWEDVSYTAGTTLSVETASAYLGSYGIRVTHDGTQHQAFYYVYESYAEATEVWVKAMARVDSFTHSVDDKYILAVGIGITGLDILAALGFYEGAAGRRIAFEYRLNGGAIGYDWVVDTWEYDTWYCLQIRVVRGGDGNIDYYYYVDGVPVTSYLTGTMVTLPSNIWAGLVDGLSLTGITVDLDVDDVCYNDSIINCSATGSGYTPYPTMEFICCPGSKYKGKRYPCGEVIHIRRIGSVGVRGIKDSKLFYCEACGTYFKSDGQTWKEAHGAIR